MSEFFLQHFSHDAEIHSAICDYYEEDKNWNNAERTSRLIEACYHAARAGQWERFHQIFSIKLNENNSYSLGYKVGDWENYLSLTRQAFKGESLNNDPQVAKEYYQASAALALKRTGQSGMAVQSYFNASKAYAEVRNGLQTARQVNNLINLFISMGKLRFAERLLELNLAVTLWIKDENDRAWQQECAYSSIAKLLFQYGMNDESLSYYRKAKAFRDDPSWTERYDIQGAFYCDSLLASGLPNRLQLAKEIFDEYAKKPHSWGDIQSTWHRLAASILRANLDCATDFPLKQKKSEELIGKALDVSDQLYQPEIQIDILLEKLKCTLEFAGVRRTLPELLAGDSCDRDLEELKRLIWKTELFLYEPERLALAGCLALFRGQQKDARSFAIQARDFAIKQGRVLLLKSPWYPLLLLLRKTDCEPGIFGKQELSLTEEIPERSSEDFIRMIDIVANDWRGSLKRAINNSATNFHDN